MSHVSAPTTIPAVLLASTTSAEAQQPRSSSRAAIACIVLAALPFLIFPRETLGLRTFYAYDIQAYFLPYRKVAADIVRSGSLPLWNPYTNAGMPLLGDGQVGLFYPPNWLFLVFEPTHALSLAILSTFSIAGLGIFGYARAIGLRTLPATAAALAFMFCGFISTHLAHVSIPATAALVPWVFWGFERLSRRPSAGALAFAGTCVAMQVFAGHPQVPAYSGAALGLYAMVIAVQELTATRRASALRPLGLLLAMYLVGGALSAVQLLPWAELSRLSPRMTGTSYELFVSNSLTGSDWVLLLFPFGYGGWTTNVLQSVPDVRPGLIYRAWERIGYVGMAPLALALLGGWELFFPLIARQGPRRRRWSGRGRS